MNTLMTRLYLRLTEAKGQAMPEYAVIVAAIIVAAYLGFQAVGTDVQNTLQTVIKALGG